MKCKVSISNDITIGVAPHDTTVPGNSPVVVELPAPMFWLPGMLNGQNKLTYNVFHRGLPIALDSHDLGTMLLHVHAPTPDPMDGLSSLNSSRKIMFGSSTVKAQKKGLGGANLIGLPPTPMLVCADPVSVPTATAVTCIQNSVNFGITPGDLAAGYALMATDMLIDYVGGKVKNPIWAPIAKGVLKSIKNVGIGAYKLSTTNDDAEAKAEVGVPLIPDLISFSDGIVREDGKMRYERGVHIFAVDIGFEIHFDSDDTFRGKLETRAPASIDGDVSIEQDGKKVTYHSDNPFKKGNQHGKVSVEEAD